MGRFIVGTFSGLGPSRVEMFCGQERFEAWDVLELGRLRVGTFWSWDVLRLGTFWGLLRTVCDWDAMGLGRSRVWTLCIWDVFRLGRFVLGQLVGALQPKGDKWIEQGVTHRGARLLNVALSNTDKKSPL